MVFVPYPEKTGFGKKWFHIYYMDENTSL